VKGFALDLLRSVGLYLLVVVGGLLCFLSLAPVIGYIPYSDRPGAGWIGRFPGVTWSEFLGVVTFLLSWATLLVPYAAAGGVLLFGIARVLERFKVPHIAVAVVMALLAGFVSGYIAAGIGWYIAIAEPPVLFAEFLGVIFGAWFLPAKKAASGVVERELES
jgi:hypothetical protein